MPTVRIGRMDQEVTFEAPVTESDGQGGIRSTGWVQVGGRSWAEVNPIKSEQKLFSGTQFGVATHILRIYRRDDLAHDYRVVWGEKTLTILAPPTVVGRNREFTELLAEEVT